MIGIMGEALIDFISKDRDGVVSFDSFVGGCALNAATAAALQDSPVGFIGKISKDMFGQRMLEHLVDNRVMFDPLLCAADEPSLLAFASLDEMGSASYAFYLDGSAPLSVTKEELLTVMTEHTDLRVVHIGSLALTLDPSSTAIIAALNEFEPRPIIFLDPNVRPAVIVDRVAFGKRMDEAMEIASIMKLSDEDLSYLYPDCDIHAQAALLAKERALHVILTLGRGGAVWYTPQGESVAMPIIDLPVIDTVGAGDTFSGSILTYLHDRDYFGSDGNTPRMGNLSLAVIEEALRWATAASAINCNRKGCDPPTSEEIAALLATL
ncbi:MAG: carbohydrate kinase [Sphaerochaeta sp.]|jgi:fructokinase|nr:carbohydrate kinase [Spirochaetales bacterium]